MHVVREVANSEHRHSVTITRSIQCMHYRHMYARLQAATEALPAAGDKRKPGAHKLTHHTKSVIGVTVGVRVVDPGGVERSQGKAKRIVDLRPRG
ncbi:acyl-CoA synthetase family protein [Rhodopila globiformis]|uniref:hypothetical protein n=1 Tax=Rhodopila globiformis TaxID=1071 RepID=UPI001304EF14|nr:hypothetical protein [Rhodopila globiformis]